MVGTTRKIISELAFSPAAVEKLAKHAQLLRRRQQGYGWAIVALSVLTLLASAVTLMPGIIHGDPTTLVTQRTVRQMALSSATFRQSVSTSQSVVRPGEPVDWTLSVSNLTDEPQIANVHINTEDIAEYAHLSNVSDGGLIASNDRYVLWPDVNLEPREEREFTISTLAKKPVATHGFNPNYPSQNDCQMSMNFGTESNVGVVCPPLKRLDLWLHQQNSLPAYAFAAISAALLILSTLIYLSLKLQIKEIRIIRSQLNSGSF